jgi:O-succinylbenzoic acid--CoA ligase
MDYPFQSIHLNEREIPLSEIVSDTVVPGNDFERHTLCFIRDWLSGRQDFPIQTSGSTGTPKQIVITRDQMIASATATAQALSLRKGDNALICLDTRFIAGQMMLVRCFNTGMSIRAVTPSANPLADESRRRFIDFVALVPYQVHSIMRTEGASVMESIRNVIVGGSALSEEDEDELRSVSSSCGIYVTYGMTETISHIALRRVNGLAKSLLYKALPGIRLETDHRSCLIVDCPYISAKVVTNDVVRLVDATTFGWLGRFDNVINSGGIKVHPEAVEKEIEPHLRRCNLHGRFVISAVSDPVWGEKVVLVIEGDPLASQVEEEVLRNLQAQMARFSAPKSIYTMRLLPVTESGKINRREIIGMLSKQL